MTLQQKMLAKKSKKGFTLVELVVVIAILAILAAIAIPAVVGIIDNAQKSQKQSNASSLDAAAKKLYAGVTAGSINSSSNDSELGGIATAKATLLPAANASTSTKRSMANALTLTNAIDYDGLTSSFSGENPQDYAYSSADGTIVYVGDVTDSTGATPGYVQVPADTASASGFSAVTFNNLYNHVALTT